MQALVRTADYRKWRLHAVHVRTTHVHVVITSDKTPERAMNDLKAWATRRLRESREIDESCVVWSRHGSTPHLWTETQVAGAVRYTLSEQGHVLPGTVYPESAY